MKASNRPPSSDPKIRGQRMRRQASYLGLTLTKAYGRDEWFMTGHGTEPILFHGLDEVEAYLVAQGMPEPRYPRQSRVGQTLDDKCVTAGGPRTRHPTYDVPDNDSTHPCASGNPYAREAALAVA